MNRYAKNILPHPEFYIAKFTKNKSLPYVIFIHGGPGFNCGILEFLLEHHNLFYHFNHNIILYDQRNCGRSKKTNGSILHSHNVVDLHHIILYLTELQKLKINGLIGHSYGAKLLFDYYKNFNSIIPGVFVSTANSILIPRLNNLMIDLSYLKKNYPEKYNNQLKEIDYLDLEKIWEVSEELTPFFQENNDRFYLYWANLEYFHLTQKIQGELNLPINMETFINVRKDLYLCKSNFSVDIDSLNIKKLWINGFHDFIMNGQGSVLSNTKDIITFYKSAHYPHIEENGRFSELINKFIKES